VLPGKTVLGFLAVVATLLFTTDAARKKFQALLGLAEKTGVGFFVALGIGVERLETHVQADRLTRRLPFFRAVYAYNELSIVAVGFANKTYPLDEIDWIESQVICPLEFKSANTEAVREGDAFVQGNAPENPSTC
jgi:hypothetical protein